MVNLCPESNTAIRCGMGSCGPPGDGTQPCRCCDSVSRSWPCYDQVGSHQSVITGGSLSLSCGATRRSCCHQDSFSPTIAALQAAFGSIYPRKRLAFAYRTA